jgi:hypothetical protein
MDRQNLRNVSSNIFSAEEQQNIELKSLLNTLKHIEKRADEYAVHEKGICTECEALHDIVYAARKAIEYHSAVTSI